MVAVRHDNLSMAFDFVSCAAPMEHSAYISLDTGKVWWTSDSSEAFDEEIPDDLETSDRYLAIPHKSELDLGSHLALRFVAQTLPACYEQVEEFFRRRGAYARFKGLLEREGVLERWYSFETDAVERALRSYVART
ncbi:hypothetical protein E1N52_32045 [Paraburkholderia guartelaensis]|uniref:Uncharacterized protein n=1 Tax=Paraburkholderia guartelaensis TaxID=2546446 RepID=A0A4R5L7F7_9BURK|nr:hypothetical protein [Paraburkholderia guartelaensis]TDG04000.1 hypothetical protein E1N52_32045 [Paraburkholderia guartelaensis]